MPEDVDDRPDDLLDFLFDLDDDQAVSLAEEYEWRDLAFHMAKTHQKSPKYRQIMRLVRLQMAENRPIMGDLVGTGAIQSVGRRYDGQTTEAPLLDDGTGDEL